MPTFKSTPGADAALTPTSEPIRTWHERSRIPVSDDVYWGTMASQRAMASMKAEIADLRAALAAHHAATINGMTRPAVAPMPAPHPAFARQMVVCETCGFKRCPHASDPANVCTGSNATGQTGSPYPKTDLAAMLDRVAAAPTPPRVGQQESAWPGIDWSAS